MGWLLLAGAIVFEIGGTLALRMASDGPRGWFAAVALGYATSFTLLSFSLSAGIPLGVAYGIWTAVGVAIIAVLGRVLFDEPLNAVMGVGILLIAGGVLLLEIGSH